MLYVHTLRCLYRVCNLQLFMIWSPNRLIFFLSFLINSFEDVGHSTDARTMMKEYLVGELIEEDKLHLEKAAKKWPEESSETSRCAIC